MKREMTRYLLAFTLVISLLLSGRSAFADACNGLEIPEACKPVTTAGIPLDGELVINFSNFHCAIEPCGFGGADAAHAKATLRLNYSKTNNNLSKMQTYTFNAFLGKNVQFSDACAVTLLIIDKFTGPILKQLFNISYPAAQGTSIKLRENAVFSFDPTIDLNAKPTCFSEGTCIFANEDYNQQFPIIGFTSVVDFKAVVLGLP